MKLTKLGWIALPFIILVSVGWAYILTTGFKSAPCTHIYTNVEQPIVVMKNWDYGLTFHYSSTYKEQGQELACIKCYNKIRQTIDYSGLRKGTTWTEVENAGGRMLFNNSYGDSLFYISNNRIMAGDGITFSYDKEGRIIISVKK